MVIQVISLIFIAAFGSSSASAEEPELIPVSYDLVQASAGNKSCNRDQNISDVAKVLADKSYLQSSKPVAKVTEYRIDPSGKQVEETIYLYPKAKEKRVMGLTKKEALLASQDNYSNSACSKNHLQGDLANRWCHADVGIGISKRVEDIGVAPAAAGLGGLTFWLLKDMTMDKNMSSSDIVYTYEDKLGTKRSTFSITIFGDSAFDPHFKKLKLFKDSTPFITFRRQLGPAPREQK